MGLELVVPYAYIDILGICLKRSLPWDLVPCNMLQLDCGSSCLEGPAAFCGDSHKLPAPRTWWAEQAPKEGGIP